MVERTTDEGEPGTGCDSARAELDRAAGDLERLIDQLGERTERVEWLESLLDEVLELLTVPALVLDDERRIVAASRAAEDQVPGVAGGLGRPATAVLPEELADDLDVVATLPGGSRLVVLPT
jgi:PAS domain-containing protein